MDDTDPEEVAKYEERRGGKHGIAKVPHVLINLFKKVSGGKKKQAHTPQAADPLDAPAAVAL